jgi:PAS domain-containing protein
MKKGNKSEAATLLQKTEVTLQDSEENLRNAYYYTRSLIEASLHPLVTINAGGKITDVNLATEKATDFPRNTLYFQLTEKRH